jgi:hypothetical protein
MDTQFVDELGTLKEYLQNELFVSLYVEEPLGNSPVTYRREDFSAEEWEEMCEYFQERTSAEVLSAKSEIAPLSATKAPAEVLVKLIGMYVLAGEPLEPLEKLHLKPESADWKKIKDLLYGYETAGKSSRRMPGMLDTLRRVATVMRGGRDRTGPKDGLTEEQFELAFLIESWQKAGRDRDEVYKKAERMGFTRSDVDRVAKIRPKLPD